LSFVLGFVDLVKGRGGWNWGISNLSQF